MRGKVCLVTGATGGIGFEIALGLACLGATTIMIGRDRARGEAALAAVRERSGSATVDLLLADLAAQRQVRQLATDFKARHDRLHVLVNNAGIVAGRRMLTEDGIERTFAVNHLAPFLLTTLLLDALVASAPARVVTVSSDAHRAGRIDFADLSDERRYRGLRAYCDSKLANVLFTYELARRLAGTGVTATCVHPGSVGTNWGLGVGGLFAFGYRLTRRFMLTPEQGARPALYAAAAPALEGVTGRYFTQKGETRSSPTSYDQSLAERLWDVSARLTHTAGEAPAPASLSA